MWNSWVRSGQIRSGQALCGVVIYFRSEFCWCLLLLRCGQILWECWWHLQTVPGAHQPHCLVLIDSKAAGAWTSSLCFIWRPPRLRMNGALPLDLQYPCAVRRQKFPFDWLAALCQTECHTRVVAVQLVATGWRIRVESLQGFLFLIIRLWLGSEPKFIFVLLKLFCVRGLKFEDVLLYVDGDMHHVSAERLRTMELLLIG
jgi:hypothetical protein